MDILYVVGRGSKHDNIELRMSLRSISKYGSNIGKVVVVGCPPKWLSDDVVKLEVKDKYSYKHQNILLCIEEAIDKGLVSGDFLYSSDDHFYIKYTDFDNYPYYIKGNLRKYVRSNDPYYKYHKSIYDTRMLCQKYGLPTMNYSQHCNTHMSADAFKKGRDIIHESYLLPYGVEPTSIIMNIWQTMPDRPKTTPRQDVKILGARDMKDIREQIGDRECFSVGDSAFSGEVLKNLFRKEYGIKSIFERD